MTLNPAQRHFLEFVRDHKPFIKKWDHTLGLEVSGAAGSARLEAHDQPGIRGMTMPTCDGAVYVLTPRGHAALGEVA